MVNLSNKFNMRLEIENLVHTLKSKRNEIFSIAYDFRDFSGSGKFFGKLSKHSSANSVCRNFKRFVEAKSFAVDCLFFHKKRFDHFCNDCRHSPRSEDF